MIYVCCLQIQHSNLDCITQSYVTKNIGIIYSLQVIDYYNKKGVVANLPAEKPPQDVTSEVKKALS